MSLCRLEGRTCAACCRGDRVSRPALLAQVRRQTRLARGWSRGAGLPPLWKLWLHELLARPPWQLVWALLLFVPILGEWLRPRLRRQVACAFLSFDSADESRVGCLLHPSRWGGAEVRPRVAFAWLRGFGCGDPGYLCVAAQLFPQAGWREQARFLRETVDLGWYDYSRAVERWSPRTEPKPHA